MTIFPLQRDRKHQHIWYRCSKMLNSVSRILLAFPARITSKTQNTLGRLRDKVWSGTSPIAAHAQEGPKQAGFCVFCLLQFSMNSKRILPPWYDPWWGVGRWIAEPPLETAARRSDTFKPLTSDEWKQHRIRVCFHSSVRCVSVPSLKSWVMDSDFFWSHESVMFLERVDDSWSHVTNLFSFQCKMRFSRFKTGMKTTADSVLFPGFCSRGMQLQLL
jgi:hypothetical protein